MTMSCGSADDVTAASARSDDMGDRQVALAAEDKLGRSVASGHLAESLSPPAIFDVAALVLFGCQAIPIRLKILLDRLLAKMTDEDAAQILCSFGWSREEYVQGYINNAEWEKCSSGEEPLILQQFLRFDETRLIAFEFMQKDEREGRKMTQGSEVKKLVERVQPFLRPDLLPCSSLGQVTAGVRLPPCFPAKAATNGGYGFPLGSSALSALYPAPTTAPSVLSPLNRLQIMKPFEQRRSPDGSLDLTMAAVSCASESKPMMPSPAASLPLPAPVAGAINLSASVAAKPCVTSSPTALNLTAATTGAGAVQKKPPSPVKHHPQWEPICPNPTALVNPVTGKKRVQCHACMKTFCDKGALKIHFSAVHLKEMHKCSVDGCTMMFSSRRSRNRHSANPNPKLHTPHMRRKISPHDGRMAQHHAPVSLPPTITQNFPHSSLLGGFNALSGFPMMPPNTELQKQALETLHSSLSTLDLAYARANGGFLLPDGVSMSQRLEQYQQDLMNRRRHEETQDGFGRPYGSDSNDDVSSVGGAQNDDDAASIDNHSINGDGALLSHDGTPVKRKRKSQNPIKFSVRLDEDDIHMSSDDSSLDDLPDDDDDKDDEDDDDDEELKNLKSDADSGDESGVGPTDLTNNHAKSTLKSGDNKPNVTACSPDLRVGEESLHSQNEDAKTSQTVEGSQPTSDSLRQLESLSKGNFGDFLGNGLMGPAPLAGLPMRNLDAYSSPNNDDDHESLASGKENDDELSNPDSSFSVSPSVSPNLMDERILNGSVPINRENPRCCIACGKMFPNHFGVKTHYQNVHLKVMHGCVVDGCKAKFPSKRSRDRHSSNYNLHRKLLSTSSDQPSTGRAEPLLATPPSTWGTEYLSRLCAAESLFPQGMDFSDRSRGADVPMIPPHPAFLSSLMNHPALAGTYPVSLTGRASQFTSRSPSPSPKASSPPAINESSCENLAKVA